MLDPQAVFAMSTIPLHQAQAELSALIHRLAPGEEVVITENNEPVARIVSSAAGPARRQLATLRGTVLHMSPEFDDPLGGFEDDS
jgi:prevent-host-death family protein